MHVRKTTGESGKYDLAQATHTSRRLAALLAYLHERRGVSRAQFERETEIDGSMVTRLLSGEQASSPKLVRACLDVYGIAPGYWTGNDSPEACLSQPPAAVRPVGDDAADLARYAKSRGEPPEVVVALLEMDLPANATPRQIVEAYEEKVRRGRG